MTYGMKGGQNDGEKHRIAGRGGRWRCRSVGLGLEAEVTREAMIRVQAIQTVTAAASRPKRRPGWLSAGISVGSGDHDFAARIGVGAALVRAGGQDPRQHDGDDDYARMAFALRPILFHRASVCRSWHGSCGTAL